MADQTTSQPFPKSPAPTGQKSPLDILEEILNEADAQEDGDTAAAGAPKAGATPAAEPQVPDAEIQAQIKQQEEQHKQQDAIALQQKIEELKTITQTPEYQAAQTQDHAKEEKLHQEEEERAATEIRQLQHTKIPVDTTTTGEAPTQ